MKRTTTVYLAVNLIGIFLFAWFVYRIEALARLEERHYRDGVDGITFFTTAVPVFMACVVVSCVWAVKILIDIVKKRGFGSLGALTVAACTWTALILSLRFLPL